VFPPAPNTEILECSQRNAPERFQGAFNVVKPHGRLVPVS
jgi:hypothetical protein